MTGVPIRLRLAVAFAVIAALAFTVGAWAFVAALAPEAEGNTLGQVERELAVAGAVFVAVAGAGAYALAGAALSPVERLRRQVASISAAGTVAGVEVPATRDEIAALAVTMNDVLGRLQRALARQRAFVSDASHELRTPLAVLRGELELAGRPGRGRDELAAAVEAADAEAARLARITDSLLLLARSDEDRLVMRPEPVAVAGLLRACAAAAGSRLAGTGTVIRADVQAGLRANMDPGRMRAAIDNLVDNALRFAPPGSAIVLSARVQPGDAAGNSHDAGERHGAGDSRGGDMLCVEVSDDGPGFPAAFLPHAFERFRRPDGGRSRDDGGSGLGLAIVHAIAVAHGGTVTAANKAGGGAVVRVIIPAGAGVARG